MPDRYFPFSLPSNGLGKLSCVLCLPVLVILVLVVSLGVLQLAVSVRALRGACSPTGLLCKVCRGWVLAHCLGAWAGIETAVFYCLSSNLSVSVTLKCQCITHFPGKGSFKQVSDLEWNQHVAH